MSHQSVGLYEGGTARDAGVGAGGGNAGVAPGGAGGGLGETFWHTNGSTK